MRLFGRTRRTIIEAIILLDEKPDASEPNAGIAARAGPWREALRSTQSD